MKGQNGNGPISGNTHARQRGSNRARPETRDNLDHRGDLELNEDPSGNNKKELHIGHKDEHNDSQASKPNKAKKAG